MEKKLFDYHNNAFDLFRIIAAFSVMLGHFAWKFPQYVNVHYYSIDVVNKIFMILSSILPGVPILFSMSGYLIYGSLSRNNIGVFIKKRFIRIYPGLWICTMINVIFIVILYKDNLDISFIKWLGTQVIGFANTPACLNNFATGSVNGALWTIFVEIELYIIAAIFFKITLKWNKKIWIISLISFVFVSIACQILDERNIASKIIERSPLPYIIWFAIGSFTYCYKEEVIFFFKKHFFKIAIVYSIFSLFKQLHIIKLPGYYTDILTGIAIPMLILGLSYKIGKIRFKIDITYELFLYHWIVLNGLVYFDLFNKIGWIGSILLFISISSVIAIFANRLNSKLIKKFG